MINLENMYIAEDLCEFILGDEDNFNDYCEKRSKSHNGLSILEYVKNYRYDDFVSYLNDSGYDLQAIC